MTPRDDEGHDSSARGGGQPSAKAGLRIVPAGKGTDEGEHTPDPYPDIDWSTFWDRERPAADFLVAGFLARGRSHALYAEPKAGKSLLALEVAAAVATGRPVLGGEASEPANVVYLDLEMTEDDVFERMTDLGYSEADDLSKLHYCLLPDLPPLDTELGGAALERLVERHGAALVVIDTTSRVIAGPENDADTFRALYRFTGARLKRLGTTVLRLDHSGKDASQGQRGSSAKADDVDVVWRLAAGDRNVTLTATHRRVHWVPERLALARRSDPLRHEPATKGPRMWREGTGEAARHLDELGAPLDISTRKARAMLKEAGLGMRARAVEDAVAWRRQEAERRASEPLSEAGGTPGGTFGREGADD